MAVQMQGIKEYGEVLTGGMCLICDLVGWQSGWLTFRTGICILCLKGACGVEGCVGKRDMQLVFMEGSKVLALQFGASKNGLRVMCWRCMKKFKDSFK